MAELFGALQRGLGAALSGIYGVIPNYAIAIALVTIAVRALLIPLTVKQIRGMAAMQKLQPETQKIRQKYKALQAKAKDRAEIQQLRLKMNEEMSALFKAHGANPASGCLPLVAQAPFFIALFSLVRGTLTVVPMTVSLLGGGVMSSSLYTDEQLKQTVCRPVAATQAGEASAQQIECVTDKGPTRLFSVSGFYMERDESKSAIDAPWVTHCEPQRAGDGFTFKCRSALSTGHISQDSQLFKDLTADKASFLGMQPGCKPTDATSDLGVRRCTSKQDKGDPIRAFPYVLVVAVIVLTQYYQSRQMAERMKKQGTDLGPAAQSQAMTMKIMPLMIGALSFTLPAGSNIYFFMTNLWTIGQQHILFARQDKADGIVEVKAVEEPKMKPVPPKARDAKPSKNASKKKKKR